MDVRFIELLPIGEGRNSEGRSNEDLLEEIRSEFPQLQADDSVHGAGPAVYYKIPGYQESIGLISAMHGKVCSSCNRVRLTSTGFLKTCLCYEDGTDLREILRGDHTEENRSGELLDAMARTIYGKPAEHCFEQPDQITEAHGMSAIGG